MIVNMAIERMIDFYKGNFHDIFHFLNVYSLAKTIDAQEKLDENTQKILELSKGAKISNIHYYREAEKKVKREQRKLSKMQKDSKNREKQRIKVAVLHEKIANQQKDFLHKQSRMLADNFEIICIENLNMKAMAKMFYFGKSVMDAPTRLVHSET